MIITGQKVGSSLSSVKRLLFIMIDLSALIRHRSRLACAYVSIERTKRTKITWDLFGRRRFHPRNGKDEGTFYKSSIDPLCEFRAISLNNASILMQCACCSIVHRFASRELPYVRWYRFTIKRQCSVTMVVRQIDCTILFSSIINYNNNFD